MNRDFVLSIALVALVLFGLGCPGGKQSPPPRAAATPAPKLSTPYASPPLIAPGESTLVCYGVEGADRIRVTPPLENVKPFLSRCVSAAPKQTTTYTFTAANASGESTATVTVTVDARARKAAKAAAAAASGAPAREPAVDFFADKLRISAGQSVMLCYDAANAAKLDIRPRAVESALPVKGCITEKPDKTTTYTLTAEFPNGHTESPSLKIQVE
jgi:hypothetical protein